MKNAARNSFEKVLRDPFNRLDRILSSPVFLSLVVCALARSLCTRGEFPVKVSRNDIIVEEAVEILSVHLPSTKTRSLFPLFFLPAAVSNDHVFGLGPALAPSLAAKHAARSANLTSRPLHLEATDKVNSHSIDTIDLSL